MMLYKLDLPEQNLLEQDSFCYTKSAAKKFFNFFISK